MKALSYTFIRTPSRPPCCAHVPLAPAFHLQEKQ
jgi:hypothetical protein